MKLLLLVGMSICLSGCVLTMEMMAISGLSYLTTGKSVSDNAYSLVTNQDCALHRIILGDPLCVGDVSEQNNSLIVSTAVITSTPAIPITIQATSDQNRDLSQDINMYSSELGLVDYSLTTTSENQSSNEYQPFHKFTVVGSFNNYQYAKERKEKYLHFKAQIIKTPPSSITKYQVVVGPIESETFVVELPIMVGDETQLPWDIELCINGMTPPPCNNSFALNL